MGLAGCDYVAFVDGWAVALCSADAGSGVVRDFLDDMKHADEIRTMPVGEAVDKHRAWLNEIERRRAARETVS